MKETVYIVSMTGKGVTAIYLVTRNYTSAFQKARDLSETDRVTKYGYEVRVENYEIEDSIINSETPYTLDQCL